MKFQKSTGNLEEKCERRDDTIYKSSATERITGNIPAKAKGTQEKRKRIQAAVCPESESGPKGNQVQMETLSQKAQNSNN